MFKRHEKKRLVNSIGLGSGCHSESRVIQINIATRFEDYSI